MVFPFDAELKSACWIFETRKYCLTPLDELKMLKRDEDTEEKLPLPLMDPFAKADDRAAIQSILYWVRKRRKRASDFCSEAAPCRAAEAGHWNVVNFLSVRGVRPRDGASVFKAAVRGGQIHVMAQLDPTFTSVVEPFEVACGAG